MHLYVHQNLALTKYSRGLITPTWTRVRFEYSFRSDQLIYLARPYLASADFLRDPETGAFRKFL